MTVVGVRRQYLVKCDFCEKNGACKDTEREAEASAKKAGIMLIHKSFYGNEVWACKECREKPEVKEEWID